MHEGISKNAEQNPALQFQQQLHSILYTPLSVGNIGRFADDALNELIELNESVIYKYQQDYTEANAYSGAALEDAAYTAYGLENLGVILDRITTVRDRIASLAVRIQTSLTETGSVIVPPDEIGPAFQDTGSGNYEAPDKLNRLITLAYILETDFDIDQDNVRYRQGTTTNTMVRQEPYVRVEIDELNRVVYICDEEGNASYVFDTEILEHLGISMIELDKMTKNQRNAFLRVTPAAGRRIVQSPAWRSVVSEALREPFANDGKVPVPTEVVPRSEFAERGRFLEFSDFVEEVRATYEEAGSPGDTQNWYRYEYKKHPGWPAVPSAVYKSKGWESFPELVGLEKIAFLEFADFVSEVQVAYEAAGSPNATQTWYKYEYKKHPGWPATPSSTYKNKGWQSYPELVGHEKAEFLEFDEFVSEVHLAYEETGATQGVWIWYQEEYKNHADWPAAPNIVYKDKGWDGFPALVGQEAVELLEFNDFASEVIRAYQAAGSPKSVYRWYRAECSNHKKWPSAPDVTYKNTGWQSYAELVGNEVVELLKFEDFIANVRVTYEKAGSPEGAYKWYKSNYKNHPGWPSNPQKLYLDKGWVSFHQISDKETISYLEFNDFVLEVKAAYEEAHRPDGVIDWYQTEYKNHPGWPSNPNRSYNDTGWQNYAELVGNEVVEFLSFTDFVQEVRKAFEASGSPNGVQKWYQEEYKKHRGWPAAPTKFYKDKGWQSYPELVGNEVVEFLPFSDFVLEVRTAYKEAGQPGGVYEWYKTEYKKHRGWPAKPDKTFKNIGWLNFPTLVGKE